MEKITGNEPAMPALVDMKDADTYVDAQVGSYNRFQVKGLTIRQHFAAMAMQGLLHQNLPVDRALNELNNNQLNACAEAAVKCADALIAQLNKQTI